MTETTFTVKANSSSIGQLILIAILAVLDAYFLFLSPSNEAS